MFHFAIESEGQGPSVCEECSVKAIGKDIRMLQEDADAMEYRDYLALLDHSFLMRVLTSYRESMQVETKDRFQLFLRALGHELDPLKECQTPDQHDVTFLQVLYWYLRLDTSCFVNNQT